MPVRSLRARAMLVIGVGLCVAAAIFAVVGARLIGAQAQTVARSELDRQTLALARTLGRQATDQATRGQALLIDSQAYLAVIGGPRTRLFYTGNPLSPRRPSPTQEIPRALVISADRHSGTGVQRVEFRAPDGGEVLEGALAPVTVAGENWGYLVLARPPGDFTAPWRGVARRVLMAAGIGLAVSLVLTVLLLGRITQPLRALKVATHRVAAGNLRTQLEPTGVRELDELIGDFNRMVRELARRDGSTREFLMRITHDLRTPLTAIRGHASALADGVVPPQEVSRSVAVIQGESLRLEGLVTDLLDLARLNADHFQLDRAPVDVAALVADAVRAAHAEATTREVAVGWSVPESLATIETDDRRVRQILANLLENAVRWTPVGGRVHVTATPASAGGVRVEVCDNGPGIPLERREEIFTPFASWAPPDGVNGSGLGLAISRELARALGGDLRPVDRPEGGACFELSLPESAPEERPLLG